MDQQVIGAFSLSTCSLLQQNLYVYKAGLENFRVNFDRLIALKWQQAESEIVTLGANSVQIGTMTWNIEQIMNKHNKYR